METNTEKTAKKVERLFNRKKRIGFEPISCDSETPNIFVEITSENVCMFQRRNGDHIPYLDVIDMESGLESKLWLSGGLRYNFQEMAGTKSLKGLKVEIEYTGQKTIEGPEGEKVKVNQYRLYELD